MKYYVLFITALISFASMQTIHAEKEKEIKDETALRNICNSNENIAENDMYRHQLMICEDVDGGGSGDGSGGGSGNNNYQIIIQCESWNYDTEICHLPSGVIGAQMIQQISETNCAGRWSNTSNSVVAYDGCRAKFRVTFNRSLNVVTAQCNSWGYSYTPCGVPIAGNSTIWLQSRQSNSKCKRNSTWGVNHAMWVDNGCRGTFASAW